MISLCSFVQNICHNNDIRLSNKTCIVIEKFKFDLENFGYTLIAASSARDQWLAFRPVKPIATGGFNLILILLIFYYLI